MSSWGQRILLHGLVDTSNISIFVDKLVNTKDQDIFKLYAPIEALIDKLHQKGYFSASLDSMKLDSMGINLYFFQGIKYKIDQVRVEELYGMIKADTLKLSLLTTAKADSIIQITKKHLLESMLLLGYPFASINIITENTDTNSISIKYRVIPGKIYPVGGLHVVGNLKISDYYIEKMISLEKGSPYDPGILKKASSKVRELTFAEQYRAPMVVFAENKAYLALFLNKKNVNRFDLLIGVQPNTSNIPGVSNKLLLTGNATIELVNQFGQGEKILGEYFQPSAMNQQLRLEAEYPFLLSTPIGLKGAFKLYRADSAFLEKIFEVGTQYYFDFDSKLEAFWNRHQSDIGTVDTQSIILTKKLPANLDYKTDYFGLNYNIQKLDFRLNPRKGFSIDLKMGVGKRNILKNDKILSIRGADPQSFNYKTLYDTVTLTSTLFKPQLDARFYLPMFKRLAFMVRANGGLISGPKLVYNNEKFRIGGNKTLRGFNEQSIYSVGYLVGTTELKMVLDELSSVFLFADNALINNTDTQLDNFYWNLGIGAGINFGTKVGVFGLSVALGKNKTVPFDFTAAKIHFGYQSLF